MIFHWGVVNRQWGNKPNPIYNSDPKLRWVTCDFVDAKRLNQQVHWNSYTCSTSDWSTVQVKLFPMLYFAKRGMITASRFTSYLHFALCMCQPFTVCMHFSIYLESMLVPLHSNLAFPFMYGLAPHGWPQTSLQEISKINICTLFEHVSTTICGALARVLLKGPGLLMALTSCV